MICSTIPMTRTPRVYPGAQSRSRQLPKIISLPRNQTMRNRTHMRMRISKTMKKANEYRACSNLNHNHNQRPSLTKEGRTKTQIKSASNINNWLPLRRNSTPSQNSPRKAARITLSLHSSWRRSQGSTSEIKLQLTKFICLTIMQGLKIGRDNFCSPP